MVDQVNWRRGIVLRLCLAVLLVVMSYQATRATAPTSEGTNFFVDALLRFEEGDYDGAIVQLKNVLKEDPRNIAARLLMGRAYLGAKNDPAAEKELNLARKHGADHSLFVVPLAKVYLLQRKFSEILTAFPVGGPSVDVRSELFVVHGNAHLALGDVEAAEKAFSSAAELRPDFAEALVGQARVVLSRGDSEAGEALVDRAAEIDPEDPEIWHLKGLIQISRKDSEGALASLDKAIAVAPEHISSLIRRAGLLLESNQADAARADLESVRALVPHHPEANYLYAQVLARAGEMAKAKDVLREIESFLGTLDADFVMNDPKSLLLAGLVNYHQGSFDDAFGYLDAFVDMGPNHVEARKILGSLLLREESIAGAIEVLLRTVQLKPDEPQLLALLGSAYLRNKQYSEATATFEKAVVLSPDGTELRTQLAWSLLATDETEEAVAGLETSFNLDPKAVQPGILLGLVRFKKGEYASSLETARTLIARDPDNPIPHNMAGTALVALEDLTAARKNFEAALEVDPDFLIARLNLARLHQVEGDI